jgi:hypothetical protein
LLKAVFILRQQFIGNFSAQGFWVNGLLPFGKPAEAHEQQALAVFKKD